MVESCALLSLDVSVVPRRTQQAQDEVARHTLQRGRPSSHLPVRNGKHGAPTYYSKIRWTMDELYFAHLHRSARKEDQSGWKYPTSPGPSGEMGRKHQSSKGFAASSFLRLTSSHCEISVEDEFLEHLILSKGRIGDMQHVGSALLAEQWLAGGSSTELQDSTASPAALRETFLVRYPYMLSSASTPRPWISGRTGTMILFLDGAPAN